MGNDRESQEVGFYVSVFGIQGSVGKEHLNKAVGSADAPSCALSLA